MLKKVIALLNKDHVIVRSLWVPYEMPLPSGWVDVTRLELPLSCEGWRVRGEQCDPPAGWVVAREQSPGQVEMRVYPPAGAGSVQ
jgi:hypothetical protein